MKWIWITAGACALLIGAVLIVGWLMPVKHTASRQATFHVPPETVWALINDVEAFPSWRSDVKSAKRLPDRDGKPAWVEEGGGGRIPLVVERSEPPRLLVLRIADPSLPFGGVWTYEIKPIANGSTLTITEDGEVYNPIFRVMSRFVFGHEATMATYLKNAEARLATAQPAR